MQVDELIVDGAHGYPVGNEAAVQLPGADQNHRNPVVVEEAFVNQFQNPLLVVVANGILEHSVMTLNDLSRKPRTRPKDQKDSAEQVIGELGFPVVIKIPDGAFSRRVTRPGDEKSLRAGRSCHLCL